VRLGNKDIKEILPELSGLGQENTVMGLRDLADQQPLPGEEPVQFPTV